MLATAGHLIVDMDLGVGFLKQWQPPTTIRGGLCKSWLIIIDWEEVVECHVLRSTLHVYLESKDAFVSIFLLMEHIWNYLPSFAQSSKNCQEVIVTN